LKNEIKKYNQRAIVDIIPNGVDLQTKLENRNLNKNIVFIGRIEINQKGLDLLLNAFNKINLPAEHKLLIAGSGEKKEEEWLKNKIGKLNNDRIEFIGRIEGENKKNFLKKAIFLIIPSRFESFSLVALEAFSYGLPVIVFNLENLKWISPECAIKVKPFDEDELARAIEKLIIDPELRMKMGDKAWEFSKDFSWDSIGKKYLDYINNVLKV
jgi:glycosyltransferase involved in cell wall biosynthesis